MLFIIESIYITDVEFVFFLRKPLPLPSCCNKVSIQLFVYPLDAATRHKFLSELSVNGSRSHKLTLIVSIFKRRCFRGINSSNQLPKNFIQANR